MNLRINNKKIINPLESIEKSKRKKSAIFVRLISKICAFSSLFLYMQIRKIGTGQLSESLKKVRSKIQSTICSCTSALGYGIFSLYNISIQALFIMIGVTAFGCVLALLVHLIAQILINRTKEEEEEEEERKVVIYQ